ncbi:methyl-accepting chemotaxis protein [Paucibacter sp. KCTC 42545]|uniref:methyl-accepting chemotaxis protein n=1 Tax=Paucibacter sp. KCTC 42545 TaxID=1768242 RepID=UPI000733B211|nr:methyl-accepting chemotaxis protein [Paucibacter sp. KCTC 42545]ALT75955.1 hypothetical protein AT984_00715 [Paucibacter sp. KCTC 42545]
MLKNLTIAGKLRAAFALLLVLLIGQALFAYSRLERVQNELHEISTNWLPSVSAVKQMNTHAMEYHSGGLLEFYGSDEKELAAARAEKSNKLEAFNKAREHYAKLISLDAERKAYESFVANWARYVELSERAITLKRGGKAEEAQQVAMEARTVFATADALIDKLVAFNEDGAAESKKHGEEVYRSALVWLALISLAALAAGALLAMNLIRAITRPLSQAQEATERVAAGDLSQPISFSGNDEIAQLLQGMQRMQQSLIATVGSVRMGADSVATASAEIAQGNADLSSRTEEQASSLEETSATMEQLQATVRQNSESASQVARDGGQVVGEVVSTMRGIETSSTRISDIISVIDGIAFQTNILALNAAVEAARAGEQGRGFAVVAAEVRTLAQRSAAASKEIKGLITSSVEQVQSGTQLVDKAGQTIQDIVSSVQKLADIVGEISSASREQSLGISQVGEAISQLDRATQQNAALVEESAAASESLRNQAQTLVGAVSSFKLDAHARTSQPAAAARASSTTNRPAPYKAPVKAAVRAPSKVATKPMAQTSQRPAPAAAKAATPVDDGDWSSF